MTKAGAPLIAVRNLSKRYGRKNVLAGVNLAVAEGQVLALLGANGAGKTTLMRIVAGLARPNRGEIVLGGATLSKAGAELRRYIGLVSHLPLLYDNLSGYENLVFFARMYDMQRPVVRIEAVLRAVDLWAARRDLVRTYSRGMMQRLAIARAILHDPPVLLLDEPDTGLDQTSAEMLHGLITRLGAANRAILLTTHNLERALTWADSLSILVGGKIVYEGETAGLDSATLRRLYDKVNMAV
jgi:heme exporter protein A